MRVANAAETGAHVERRVGEDDERVLAKDVEDGLVPNDDGLLGPMIENICYGNARDFLGLELGA